MAPAQTLLELIAQGADDAEAIAAPERVPLTYGRLRRHLADTVAALNHLGLGRADRVAMVLPNGPEMAAAAIAVAAGATAAPLNPTYLGQEFAYYLVISPISTPGR